MQVANSFITMKLGSVHHHRYNVLGQKLGKHMRLYQRIISANLKTPTAVAVALQADAIQFDYRAGLKKLNRPLMFASQGDTPSAQAKIVLAEVPAARVEAFPSSGHALFLDDPERFNRVLGDFIGSLPKN